MHEVWSSSRQFFLICSDANRTMTPSFSNQSRCLLVPLSTEASENVQGGAISIPVLSLNRLLPRFGSDASPASADSGASSITNIGSIGTSMVSVGAIYL